MAKRFYLDASVLAKRYVAETGTPVVNYLFPQVAREDMMCLALGTVEVLSIFVRKKNANAISLAVFNQAMTDFRSEVIDAPDFTKVSLPDPLLYAAMPLRVSERSQANFATQAVSSMSRRRGAVAVERSAALNAGGETRATQTDNDRERPATHQQRIRHSLRALLRPALCREDRRRRVVVRSHDGQGRGGRARAARRRHAQRGQRQDVVGTD